MTDIAFSIEHRIRPKGSGPLPAEPTFTAQIQGKTVRQVLDWLCELDPRYAWLQDGNTANIFPRSRLGDRNYLFNRTVPNLTFSEVKNASDAVFAVLRQAPGPEEQLALLQSGGSLEFAKPWTSTFTNLTVRQAFNRIAHQLGTTNGWQFTGTEDFQLVMFHTRLHPRPRPGENPEEPFVRPEQ